MPSVQRPHAFTMQSASVREYIMPIDRSGASGGGDAGSGGGAAGTATSRALAFA